MSITCDRINKILHMSQKSYVEKIFERFNMTNCKIASIFMNVETKLKFNIEDAIVSEVKLFQIMMNNLIYLIYCTRLNVLRCAHGHLAVSRLDGYHVPVSRDTPIRGCFGMTQCAKPSLYISRASHLDSTSSLLLATTIQT